MTAAQERRVLDMVEAWRKRNPKRTNVAAVRLTDFSSHAGDAAVASAEASSGLLSNVKSVTRIADQGLLLAERGVFLVQRMPFLLRLQVRVGAREVTGDAVRDLSSYAEPMLAGVQGVAPLLQQVGRLAAQSTQAAQEARLLVNALKPLLPGEETAARLERGLGAANNLAAHADHVVQGLREVTAHGMNPRLEIALDQADRLMRRALLYVFAGLIAAILVFWAAYFVVKRLLARRA